MKGKQYISVPVVDYRETEDGLPTGADIMEIGRRLEVEGTYRYLPGDGTTFYTPAPGPGDGGDVRMLNSYMGKEIKGVHYRVHSIFAAKGDFQQIYERSIVKCALRHYRECCAGAQPVVGRKGGV